MQNVFAPEVFVEDVAAMKISEKRVLIKPDYSVTPNKLPQHILSFIIGFAVGFVVLFVFYKVLPLSFIGGAAFGAAYISIGAQNAITKRRKRLRLQFRDML